MKISGFVSLFSAPLLALPLIVSISGGGGGADPGHASATPVAESAVSDCLVAGASSPRVPGEDEGCRRCDHLGVVPCSKHSDELREAEGRVMFCSLAAHCEDCAGALFIDCKHCDGGPKNAEVEARRVEIAKWMEANPVEAHFGRKVARCETHRFEIVLDLQKTLKEGRKKVDPHLLMHWVADDCEHVSGRILEHYETDEEKEIFAKMRMWMWQSSEDHISAVETFMRISARGDFKMLGKAPVFSVWLEPGLFSTVSGIRTVFAHNAGHMILSNMYRERDVGPIGGGWFDAGAGHWYEYDRFDRSVNYCTEEATARTSFANGVWKAAMKKLLARTDEPQIPSLLNVPTTAMTVQQQAVCWSFYDWLVAEHRKSLRPILRGLKQKTPTRELLQSELGLTVLQAEEAWRAWVESTYPDREKKRR